MDPSSENRDDFRYKHKANILLETYSTGAYWSIF
jgi:hypothetical protein